MYNFLIIYSFENAGTRRRGRAQKNINVENLLYWKTKRKDTVTRKNILLLKSIILTEILLLVTKEAFKITAGNHQKIYYI